MISEVARSSGSTRTCGSARSVVTSLKVSSLLCLVFIQLCLALACRNKMSTDRNPCKNFELVTRAEWGARVPRAVSNISGSVNMTFVHHTAGTWQCEDKETCIAQVQDIQNLHMDKNGWDDIGYSFLIGEDGRVYEGRGWQVVGAHTFHYNAVAYGFCIIGNYMKRAPKPVALQTTQDIIDCGVQLGHITKKYELFGHRDGRCTECPGDVLYDIIKTWPHFSTRNITRYC